MNLRESGETDFRATFKNLGRDHRGREMAT